MEKILDTIIKMTESFLFSDMGGGRDLVILGFVQMAAAGTFY